MGSPRGYFAHLPHYLKLFEVMEGAYKANKITLKTEASSRLGDLIKVSLEVLAIVVEVEGQDFHSHAEEVLAYLQVVIVPEPRAVLLCVHQLMVALFGPGRGRSGSLTGATSDGLPSNPLIPTGGEADGFFERCIGVSRDHLGKMTRTSEDVTDSHAQSDPGNDSVQSGAASPRVANKTSQPKSGRGASNGSVETSMKLTFVKLFEPLVRSLAKPCSIRALAFLELTGSWKSQVIRAMNQYTTTSSIPLQQQILFLLCRLMVLRVNYALLDGDRLFFNSVLRQLELVKRGHVRESQQLLSYIFQFLILLAQGHTSMAQYVDMAKVLALAAEVVGSSALRPRQALPALRPIVHELFVVSLRAPPRSRADLEAMQDKVIGILMGVIAHPPVLDQLYTLLRGVASDEERHRRLSRKVVDALLPLMSRREVAIRNPRVLWIIHRLMESLAPISLRPVVLLLRCMFDAAAGAVPCRALKVAATATGKRGDGAWLPIVLVVLKVLAGNPEGALLAGLEDVITCAELPESDVSPAGCLVEFFFAALVKVASDFVTNPVATEFDSQQFAQLLQFIFVILNKSDSRILLTSAKGQAKVMAEAMMASMRLVVVAHPLIAIYWCQLLLLLRVDGVMWSTPCGLDLPTSASISCGQDVARRGAFLLHCESILAYHSSDLTGEEVGVQAMTADCGANTLASATSSFLDEICSQDDGWFGLLFALCDESPVKQLLAAATRCTPNHPQLLGRVEKALLAVPAAVRDQVSFITRLLGILCAAPSSPALLSLLIRRFLPTRHLSARRLCDSLTAEHLRVWLGSIAGSVTPSSDACEPNGSVETAPPHPKVVSELFALFSSEISKPRTCPRLCAVFTELGSSPFPVQSATMEQLVSVSPDSWHLQFVSSCCQRVNRGARSDHAVCELLRHLQPDALVSVLKGRDFDCTLLLPCIRNMQWHAQEDLEGQVNPASANHTGDNVLDLGSQAATPHAAEISALACVCEFLLSRIQAVVGDDKAGSVPSHIDWEERMALMSALVQYLHLDFAAHALPELVPSRISATLRFLADTLGLVQRQPSSEVSLLPCHVVVLLDCAGGIFCQQPVLASVTAGSYSASCLRVAVDAVYALYRSLCIEVLSPDPSPPDEQTGEKGESATASRPQDGDPRDTVPSGDVLPLVTRHRLCNLIRRLKSELGEQYLAGVRKGILTRHASACIPVEYVRAFRRCTIRLARAALPEVHAYCLVCNPETGRPSRHTIEFLAELAGPGGDGMRQQLLQDEVVVAAMISRVCAVGHDGARVLREVTGDLLSILDPESGQDEDRGELDRGRVFALRGLSSLVVDGIRDDSRNVVHIARGRELPFLQTSAGQKLLRVRRLLQEAELAERDGSTAGDRFTLPPQDPFLANIERGSSATSGYGHGQVSVAVLASRCRDTDPVVSPDTSIAGSISQQDSANLLKTISRWLEPTQTCALSVTRQCLWTLTVIADSFSSLDMHRQVVELLASMSRTLLAEDSPLLRHAVPAMCKSYAVASTSAVASTHTDVLVRLVGSAIQSVCISNQLAALHGVLPLLEAKADDAVKLLFPLLTDHIVGALAEATGPEHISCLIAVAFAVLEFYPNLADDRGFTSRVVQAAVQLAQLPSCPDAVFESILRGLDRLLLCFTLEKTEQLAVASLARASFPDSIRSRRGALVLGLMMTCMYSGRDAARPSGLLGSSSEDAANANHAMDTVAIETMERIAALFGCIRKGGAPEARLLEQLLPSLLDDFLPPRQIMNIVMGEFSSTQQPHPELVAAIVHRVSKPKLLASAYAFITNGGTNCTGVCLAAKKGSPTSPQRVGRALCEQLFAASPPFSGYF